MRWVLAGLALVVAAGAAHAAPKRSPSWAAQAARLNERIAASRDSGNLVVANVLADSAYTLRRKAGLKPPALAAYADSLALGFFAAGNAEGWQLASQWFERSLGLKERALGPRNPDVARTLTALATLDDYLGRWDKAAERAQRALEIRIAALGPRDVLVASSLRQLGMARFELGDHAAADSALTASLAIYESLPGDHRDAVADALNNLGETARVANRFDLAESRFRRGLDVAAHVAPDAPIRVSLMNNLAGLYKDLGRYDDAEPLLRESLRLRESAAEPDSLAIAAGQLNLAEVERLQGRLLEAEGHYASGLLTARSILGPDHPLITPFANQAAALYQELGAYDRAQPLLEESAARAERTLGPDHPLLAQALDDLGKLRVERGAWAGADSALSRALDIRVRRLGADHPDAAVTRVHLAESASRNGSRPSGTAVAMLDSALARLDASDTYPESRLEALALRAELREHNGDAARARADLDRALSLIDTLRVRRGGGELSRAALLTRHLDLYDRSVRLHLADGDRAAALESHERGRARVLLDQLAAARLDPRAGIPAAELEPLAADETRARERLAHTQRDLESARRDVDPSSKEGLERIAALEAARDSAAWELQRSIEAIRNRSPIWRQTLAAHAQPSGARAVSEVLGADEALLEYHLGAEASYVFLVDHGRDVAVAALTAGAEEARVLGIDAGPVSAGEVERMVAGDSTGPIRTRTGVVMLLSEAGGSERERGDEVARLATMWNVLVPASIRSRLMRAMHVVIVPDGALHLLPFEALVTRTRSGRPEYWLDRGPSLRYAASGASLAALARRASPPSQRDAARVLSVSNPEFGGASGRWVPLPGTELETAAIRAAFGGHVDTLTGASATESAVRAALPRHDVLHLATHGFVTERYGGTLAGLALAAPAAAAPTTDDDGLLQLFEIYGLHLDADLVVLSACETARGQRVAGEGVFALSRGFVAAGARRVVASLWRVQDASTADLMREMFDRLARSKSPASIDHATVLRDAKRALRSRPDYEDPFYWAPFVITGDR